MRESAARAASVLAWTIIVPYYEKKKKKRNEKGRNRQEGQFDVETIKAKDSKEMKKEIHGKYKQ